MDPIYIMKDVSLPPMVAALEWAEWAYSDDPDAPHRGIGKPMWVIGLSVAVDNMRREIADPVAQVAMWARDPLESAARRICDDDEGSAAYADTLASVLAWWHEHVEDQGDWDTYAGPMTDRIESDYGSWRRACAAVAAERAAEIIAKCADRCPVCKSTDVTFDPGVCDYAECSSCGHDGESYTFWPTRDELGLSPDCCEACGRRLSWGCGHTHEQELEALGHIESVEHKSGACSHYSHEECRPNHCKRAGVSTPGYAAFVSHVEQAIRYGAADPRSGEAFSSAQRQAWIDTGRVPDIEDTFPT